MYHYKKSLLNNGDSKGVDNPASPFAEADGPLCYKWQVLAMPCTVCYKWQVLAMPCTVCYNWQVLAMPRHRFMKFIKVLQYFSRPRCSTGN